jgi:Fic family protein
MPDGVEAEEVWRCIKSGRIPYVSIPFHKPSQGLPDVFTYVQTSSILRRLHELDRGCGAGLIPLPRDVLTKERRDRYMIRSLIEESITSSQLEGAATTREQAKDMIRNKRPPRNVHERMIINNYATMEFLRGNMPRQLDVGFVLGIHHRVSMGVLDKADASGRFRLPGEDIKVVTHDGEILHTPPPAEELEQRVQNMCRFANGESESFIHPVLRAIILHFWLAYDHPFVDGNGRTARALFYWAMLNAGYEIFEFISISEYILKAPVKYGQAFLYAENDDKDLTYFIEHQLGVIEAAGTGLRNYVNLQLERQQALGELIRVQVRFNHRQQALLGHAIRHPGWTYTIQGHQVSHGITNMTARSDLTGLVKSGLLIKEKQGKAFIFIVPGDVLERVKAV